MPPWGSPQPPPGPWDHSPTAEAVGEGMTTQVPLSRRLPLGQVQTGPLGLSRQSHSHFLRSQGLVTVGGTEGTTWGEARQAALAPSWQTAPKQPHLPVPSGHQPIAFQCAWVAPVPRESPALPTKGPPLSHPGHINCSRNAESSASAPLVLSVPEGTHPAPDQGPEARHAPSGCLYWW